MAKRVRRVRRPRAATNNNVMAEAPIPARTPPRQTSEEELQEEYAYVLRDLRRIFILAVLMFALLIALNFALR
jgi:hypothetical protein